MGQREVGAIGGALECQGPEGQKARLASLVYKVLMGGMDYLGNQGWTHMRASDPGVRCAHARTH